VPGRTFLYGYGFRDRLAAPFGLSEALFRLDGLAGEEQVGETASEDFWWEIGTALPA